MSSVPNSPSITRPRGDSMGSISSLNEDEMPRPRPVRRLPPSPKIQKKDLHPVIASMVNGNTLRDCRQVKDFYGHCVTKSVETDSHVCKTAARYHDICEGGN